MTTKHPADIFVCRTISTQKTNKMFTPDASISQFVSLSTHVSPTIVKTTGGDYLTTWHLSGLPFVGREEWELEHKHNTFNRLLQSLRAPDYVNVAFWVHDIRRHRGIDLRPKFQESFNQSLSDRYFSRLSKEKLMNNELYLTMIYRPVVDGKKFVDKSGNIDRLKAEQEQAIGTLNELATNLEAVLKDYHPYRLGMYEGKNGTVFSETLELFGYILNRVNEPVPVLPAPVYNYLPLSRHLFSAKTGDYIVRTPEGKNYYGAILNLKEYPDGTYPGVLNGLKYLDVEYVITHSFSPMSRYDAMKTLERTRGMMISSGDKSFTQIAELDHAMDQLASGNFVLGGYHFSLAIYADSQEQLSQNIAAARAELSNAGFVTTKEDLAVCAAYYAQLPGNWNYRTRIANLSSLNFLGLCPLHNLPPANVRATHGDNALPFFRQPMASPTTSTSMQPSKAKIPKEKKPLPILWLLVSPVQVKQPLSTSSSVRYKNTIPNPLSFSSIKTVVPKFLSEPAAVLIWHWKAVSLPALTLSNAKIQRQMSNSSAAL